MDTISLWHPHTKGMRGKKEAKMRDFEADAEEDFAGEENIYEENIACGLCSSENK